ncbi:MAG: DNA topoisomerase III [Oscillospiraceae bacterium]|nr:DNA topoisomerase III [Oscillospiraceae bacterium]
MGKIMVLAEKPSVGRELARVLGCKQSREGYIEGSNYIVTWALGHLVTLADPEYYGDKYKKWNLETLPMLPAKLETVVIKETSRQYKVVKDLLRSPTVGELVIATDAGREGELVARWIIEKAGFKKPIKRLWISSQTDKAIKEGFRSLHPAREYENLYYSALCRAQADWLVGLNVTRALTCKFNAQLSAGRVQTPTLAMIVEREEEIRKFSAKEYYTVTATLPAFDIYWKDKKSMQGRTFDKTKAEDVVHKIEGGQMTVTEVRRELKRERAPLLYDLTELQRDANRRYGFSAKQTLGIMQQLYEKYKLLTYPRTDSRYLTADIVPTLTERLHSIDIGPYSVFVKAVLRQGVHASKHFVDNSKVSDHHAIIPTEQYVELSKLATDERRVYDLVVKRFLAVLSPDFEYEQVTMTAECSGEFFTAKGKIVIKKGWKAIYEGAVQEDINLEDEKEQLLPDVKKGQTYKVVRTKLCTGKTKPPARYNEATLLTAMEHPGKFIESNQLRSVMDASNGIGTPATRADIIEKLFSANYMERRGKEIVPLSKGIQLVALVPQDLRSPELTAKWEQKLTLISKGTLQQKVFTDEIRGYATRLVSGVIASDANYRHDNMTRTPCPQCGKFMLEINGKHGKMLVCSDRVCGYRQNLSFLSNARCPNCHKKLEILGDGDNKKYICHTCGFREKYEYYNKKLSETHGGASKAEVRQYLNSKSNEPPAMSAFAQAWANANGGEGSSNDGKKR